MTKQEYLQTVLDQGITLWFNSNGSPARRLNGCLSNLARVGGVTPTATFTTDTPPTLEDYKALLGAANSYTLSVAEDRSVQCIMDTLKR